MAEPKYSSRSKTWTGLVYSHTEPSGKRKYQSITAPTKREWKQLEAEFKANRKGKTAKDMTIRDCIEQYIDSKSGVLSPSTLVTYQSYKKKLAPLYDIRLSAIDSADVQYCMSNLSKELKANSLHTVYVLLMASINMADDTRRFKVTLPTDPPHEYNIPSDREVLLLMENAVPEMKLCIALAAFGTLRRGEVCALEYSDVLYDFDAVYVHSGIVKDKDKGWIKKEMPKTAGSVRRIILPENVMDMIGHGEGPIIHYNPGTLSRCFAGLRKRLGLKCRFHDLRHYAASTMHAMGIPDKYIMERGGWSSDRVLKEIYQNVLPDRAKVFTEKVNDYYTEMLKRIS